MPQDVGYEHRAGFLDVVGAGMQKRVGGELRPLCQIDAFGTPGHMALTALRPSVGGHACGVETYAHGDVLVEPAYEGIDGGFGPHSPKIAFKALWQSHIRSL